MEMRHGRQEERRRTGKTKCVCMSDSSELSDVLHAEELMLDQFRHI